MNNVQILLTTIDDLPKAKEIARRLIIERLVACVNILPELQSVYKWQGEVVEEGEILMIMKTSGRQVSTLIDRLKELHPYEVPEAVAFSVERGHGPYLDWVVAETGGENQE